MTKNFADASKMLKIIDANKRLTIDNYSKQEADNLAQSVWDVIQSYVSENLSVYQNWDSQDYPQRKKFIGDILNLLLERFPSDITPTPKIYFQEDIKPIWPSNIPMPSACFYSPELSPWANDMVKSALGSTNPFFAFFHDLSDHGLLGQITHEFTHYLQSIGASTLSLDVVKQAADYYQYYYADKKKYKQIYADSIHEYEAREVGEHITKQLQLLIANSKENVEIQVAKQTVDLLKELASVKTQEQKDALLKQLSFVNLWAHKVLTNPNKHIEPLELAERLEKAIKLDQYRPKNMNLVQLALSKDLDYVGGDFDTFDGELNKMFKDKADPEKIRNRFKAGTANIYTLEKQFSADWIQRLKNHKDLVDAARKAGEENIADVRNQWAENVMNHSAEDMANITPSEEKILNAYNDLFYALSRDFCDEYNCIIDAKLVKDWATSDKRPEDLTLSGFHSPRRFLELTNDMSDAEKQKQKEEFLKDPNNHPNSKKMSIVRVNLSYIANTTNPKDLFAALISSFAHEMHHALDYQNARQGALGPQISLIDAKTYVSHGKDKKAYFSSASEISSYEIERELLEQLKHARI